MNKAIKMGIMAILAFALAPSITHATEEGLKEARNRIDSSYDELLSLAGDSDLNPISNSTEDNEAKVLIIKSVVKDAINLSIQEVVALKKDMETLPQFSAKSREQELKSVFAEELSTFAQFYNIKMKELNRIGTLEDGRALAEEIITYREKSYNPRISQLLEFLLLFYNENVIKTAEEKTERISKDVEKLEKLGFLKTDSFLKDFDTIASLINQAYELKNQAKIFIINPALKLNVSDLSEKSKEKEDVTHIPEPRLLMEDSLGKIKIVYDIFIDVSKSIRKTLGLK
ncbi:MAG TPA: hypothetical protein VI432_01535 [Candidatus Paceibacterota bacterium]